MADISITVIVLISVFNVTLIIFLQHKPSVRHIIFMQQHELSTTGSVTGYFMTIL